MNLEKRVRELVDEKLADRPDLFIVSIKIINNANVTVLLDGDDGLGIHDCAMVSRHVGFHLEEENAISDAYTLEVSSPGIGSPLILGRQFQKNINRTLALKLKSGDKLEGVLLAAADDNITISVSIKEKGKKLRNEDKIIAKSDIAEALVQVSFK
ncbi:MAG: ribosome assembly cofactor RimP [Sphingobacteriales bacterium]|nr:MAG: ribosome assembly cofactor RimP [Sphingobacteriales bacterium]